MMRHKFVPGMHDVLRVFTLLSLFSLIGGCASVSEINDGFARDHGWSVSSQQGELFHHRLYLSGEPSGRLHVYIEGDGRPWVRRVQINPQPEESRPLMLRLMAQDLVPAVYLTRPCYNREVGLSRCQPWYWTQGRYSEDVVASMTKALQSVIQKHEIKAVNIYGHSGGGVLGTLLANRIPEVKNLVTVAANLDINVWTDHHQYSRMEGSLNPVDEALRRDVRQFHYLGAEDDNVPPEIFPLASHPPQVLVKVLPTENHVCCWEKHWSSILEQTSLNTTTGGKG